MIYQLKGGKSIKLLSPMNSNNTIHAFKVLHTGLATKVVYDKDFEKNGLYTLVFSDTESSSKITVGKSLEVLEPTKNLWINVGQVMDVIYKDPLGYIIMVKK